MPSSKYRRAESRFGFKVNALIDVPDAVTNSRGDTASKTNYREAVRAAQKAEVILYGIIIVPIEIALGRDTGGDDAPIQLSRDTGEENISTPAAWSWRQLFERSAHSCARNI